MAVLKDLWDLVAALSQLKSVLPIVLPVLLPYFRRWYYKNQSKQDPISLSTTTAFLIAVLVGNAVWQVVYSGGFDTRYGSFSWSIPENIITATKSRIQTTGEVLASRLAKLRPLSEEDAILTEKLGSLDGRVLYTLYGPRTLIDCLWCEPGLPLSYLMFSAPAIVFPYLVACGSMLAATSSEDRNIRQWRLLGLCTIAIAAGVDLFTYMTPRTANQNRNAKQPSDIEWVYWNRLQLRALYLSLHSLVFAVALFLAGTRRMFVVGPSAHSRLMALNSKLDESLRDLTYDNMARQVIHENPLYRAKQEEHWQQYWADQDELNRVLDENPAVRQAKDNAKQRVNIPKTQRRAHEFLSNFPPNRSSS